MYVDCWEGLVLFGGYVKSTTVCVQFTTSRGACEKYVLEHRVDFREASQASVDFNGNLDHRVSTICRTMLFFVRPKLDVY